MTTTSRRGWAVISKRGQRRAGDWQRMAILCGSVLLLLVPSWATAQQPPKPAPPTVQPAKQDRPPVIVGESYDAKAVAAAEARIKDDLAMVDASKRGKTQQLNVGEFEIFHPKMENGKPVINSPVTWLAINSKLARKIEIPAGVEFAFVGKRKGDTEEKLHEFSAEPFTWWMLLGRQQGFTPLVLVENGADPKKNPPRVADQMDLTVGKPAPGPVDPIDPPPLTDPYIIAAKNDVRNGRGTAEDVRWYGEYFRAAAVSLPAVITWKTSYDFLDAFDTAIHDRLGKATDAGAKLMTMRRAIADELNRTVTKANVPFDGVEGATNKRAFADAFLKIAERLKGFN